MKHHVNLIVDITDDLANRVWANLSGSEESVSETVAAALETQALYDIHFEGCTSDDPQVVQRALDHWSKEEEVAAHYRRHCQRRLAELVPPT